MTQASREFVFSQDASGELKLVGDFDGLYSSMRDPWGQTAAYNDEMSKYYTYSRSQLLSVVQRRANSVNKSKFMRGLEVGCGFGYVAAMLTSFTSINFDGMDVSKVAIDQARDTFPYHKFMVGDITRPLFTSDVYDIVILGQLLWYVMHEMHTVVLNCYNLLRPGGLLIVSQAFLKEQKYGLDIANGFDGTLKLLMGYDRFKIVEARFEDNLGLQHNDGIIVLRKE